MLGYEGDDPGFFRMNAAAIRARGCSLPHLDQDVAIRNDIRIADEVAVLDRILYRIQLLNMFAGVMGITARKVV